MDTETLKDVEKQILRVSFFGGIGLPDNESFPRTSRQFRLHNVAIRHGRLLAEADAIEQRLLIRINIYEEKVNAWPRTSVFNCPLS